MFQEWPKHQRFLISIYKCHSLGALVVPVVALALSPPQQKTDPGE